MHCVSHSFPTRRSSDLEGQRAARHLGAAERVVAVGVVERELRLDVALGLSRLDLAVTVGVLGTGVLRQRRARRDRKSTRLNSSHLVISYAVFCLKKKKT